MKTRLGLVLATSALIGAGGCASGGGSTSGGGVSTSTAAPAGETIDPGESPRENEHTEAADEHLDQGDAALEEEDEAGARMHYEEAAAAADQAIALDERNPLPWLQGGLAHLGLENYQAADSMLTRAEELRPLYELDLDPMREQVWVELYQDAAPLVSEGDYDAAAEIFEDAHHIYKERPEAMLTLGQIWAQQGRYDEAVEILQRGLELVNDEELRETMDEETLTAWEEQAEGIPAVIAQSLMNAGRFEEGADALRALVAENPENLEYRRNLANLYVQMELPDSAEAIYTELLETGALGADANYQIGIGLYQIGLYDRAAAAFQETVTDAPQDRDAAEMWARSIQIANQPGGEAGDTTPEPILQELQEASELWLELDPYNQNAHVVLAQTENRLGNQERAAELIRAVEQLPVTITTLQLQRMPTGGTVQGTIQNVSLDAGTPVTVEVTFYGEGTAPVGSESVTVELPAPDATQNFEVVFESETRIRGYTYTIDGL